MAFNNEGIDVGRATGAASQAVNMIFARFVLCMCGLIACHGVSAKTVSVVGSELRPLVSGALLHLDTPLGTKIPVSYSCDGALSGNANGLGSYLGSERDKGRWWVKKDRLCHRWDVWFDARPQCLRLHRRGKTIYWQNEAGKSGTATLIENERLVAAGDTMDAGRVAKSAEKALESKNSEFQTVVAKAGVPEDGAAKPARQPVKIETLRVATVPLLGSVRTEQAAEPQEISSRLTALASPGIGLVLVEAKGEAGAAVAEPEREKIQLASTAPVKRIKTHALPQPTYRISFVEPFDVLNVRAGPSTESAVVAGLKPRSGGIIITSTCRVDWCPIRYGRIRGWVNRFYLQEETAGGDAFAPARTSTWSSASIAR